MNTKTVVVHCEYSEEGKDISEIILESFRLFLQKEFRTFAIATQDGVSLIAMKSSLKPFLATFCMFHTPFIPPPACLSSSRTSPELGDPASR